MVSARCALETYYHGSYGIYRYLIVDYPDEPEDDVSALCRFDLVQVTYLSRSPNKCECLFEFIRYYQNIFTLTT